MATFALVHGSNVGGEAWRHVVPLLKAAAHEVFNPTLTGLGDQAHRLTPEVDLHRHVEDVASALDQHDLSDVILVGHSYSGLVITGVVEQVPERIRHLVYLDAWAQQDGRAISELAPAVIQAGKEPDVAGDRGWRWQMPNPEATLKAWGIVDEEELQWWLRQIQPHPLKTFQQGIVLGNPVALVVPKTYILCTAGKGADSPFLKFAEHAKTAPGWSLREIPTGHLPMSTTPMQLVDLLVDVV